MLFPKKFKGVPIYNKKPLMFPTGGKIKKYPGMTEKQIKNDSVHIIAMPGELIIPYYTDSLDYIGKPKRKYNDGELVDEVIKYLKNDLKVKLPGI